MGECRYTCFCSRWIAALMFASSIVMQIMACAVYKNWWPLLTVIMYLLVPIPCLFFGGGSTSFITSINAGDWADAAKFLTGFSMVGSIAIPSILLHAHAIKVGAMLMQLSSFFLLALTVLIFDYIGRHDDEWLDSGTLF